MNYKSYLLLASCLIGSIAFHAQEIDPLPTKGNVSIDAHANISRLVKAKFSENYGDNYKIQLYYGNLNKAHEILNNFNSNYPQWPGKILFETPNYKVWVGNYRTRLEADRALMDIRKKFSSAFIFKPKKVRKQTE